MKKVLGSAARGAFGAAGTANEEMKTSRPRGEAEGLAVGEGAFARVGAGAAASNWRSD
jgi:hypothetical protein